MQNEWIAFIASTLNMWAESGFYYLFLALLFTVLTKGNECNKDQRYWIKANVVTDLLYLFIIPIFTKYIRLFMLILVVQYAMGMTDPKEQAAYFKHGFGPLAELPIVLQACLILVLSDIILYWAHRTFHSRVLWPFHAVHHSSKQIDWPSAYRFHPINTWATFTAVDVLIIMVGFSPEAFAILIPFNIFYSAFVHANLNWTLGPLQYVLASPVFHRWHHTMPTEGGNKNFAPTFPILDIIFGTYYMPKDRLPEHYGVTDDKFPVTDFAEQIFYPFRK